MKLQDQTTHRREGRGGKRFYTQLDMAIIKHDTAVQQARVNRGEIVPKAREYISVCGCGCEGCFIHSSYDPPVKET